MKHHILKLVLFLIVPWLNVQGQDIKIEDVHYNSPLEKAVFEDYIHTGKVDHFSLFIALTPNVDSSVLRNAFSQFQHRLDKLQPKTDLAKIKKTVKKIYNNVHYNDFYQFEDNVDFIKIFQDGTYNCVTSVAYFAMIFDNLGIKYQIEQKPNHIYLVADPNGKDIKLETTSPIEGFINFDDRFKINFVETLMDQKVIGQKEAYSQNHDELFKKYYFQDKELNLTQLAGLHYYNDGIEKWNKKEYQEAVSQFEKAYILYPSEDIHAMLISSLKNSLQAINLNTVKAAQLFTKLANYTQLPQVNGNVLLAFRNIAEKIAIIEDKGEMLDSIYMVYRNKLRDENLEKEIESQYYFYKGKSETLKGNLISALNILCKSYQLNKDNLEVQSQITKTILDEINQKEDLEAIHGILKDNENRFDFLASRPEVKDIFGQIYLALAAEYFAVDDTGNGNKYLNKFRDYFSKQANSNVNQDLVGRAYGEASAYFVRNDNRSKAKALLKEGQEIAPRSEELYRKKKYLSE